MKDNPQLPGTTETCEILEMPSPIVAIYFLIRRHQVMYVGKTKNLLIRTWSHEANSPGHQSLVESFDEVRFIRCSEDELDAEEKRWIVFYDPPWNRVGARRKKYGSALTPCNHFQHSSGERPEAIAAK